MGLPSSKGRSASGNTHVVTCDVGLQNWQDKAIAKPRTMLIENLIGEPHQIGRGTSEASEFRLERIISIDVLDSKGDTTVPS